MYLDKTTLTLKRWIKDRLIPEPVLVDTVNGYRHYSVGELKLIAKILREHAKLYDYLHFTHDTTINTLWQQVEAYRKSHV